MSNKPTSVITDTDVNSKITPQNLVVKCNLPQEEEDTNIFKNTSNEKNVKNVNKSIKEKIVNKVKSWNREKTTKESAEVDINLSKSFKRLNISSNSAEPVHVPVIHTTDDNIENRVLEDSEAGEDFNSKPSTSEKSLENRTACENISMRYEKSRTSNVPNSSRNVGTEDQKTRRLYKKSTKTSPNKDHTSSGSNTTPTEGTSCLKSKIKDEKNLDIYQHDVIEGEFPFKYKYFPKNSKSVVFTNEVFVVYFNGGEVICESKEPLKKGLEQQMRNKEMRYGHLLKTQEKYNLCLF